MHPIQRYQTINDDDTNITIIIIIVIVELKPIYSRFSHFLLFSCGPNEPERYDGSISEREELEKHDDRQN